MTINFYQQSEIQESIARIEDILSTDIFLQKNANNPLCRSAFIEVMICLRDLMYKADKFSSRISFDDDVVKSQSNKINDITDVIKYVRDALCHLDSCNHYFENSEMKATFNIAYGRSKLCNVGGNSQASDYEEDVCFFFGNQKIYLKLHILRAFKEAKNKLMPLIS